MSNIPLPMMVFRTFVHMKEEIIIVHIYYRILKFFYLHMKTKEKALFIRNYFVTNCYLNRKQSSDIFEFKYILNAYLTS